MNEICESCNRPIKNGYFPTKLEVKIIRYINDFQANNKNLQVIEKFKIMLV